MEQALATALVVIALGISQPAVAQKNISADDKPAQQNLSLDKRYDNCIGNPECRIQERMALMIDIGNRLREVQKHMDQNCLILSYNECIGPQLDERAEWHKNHKRLGTLMQSLEDRTAGMMMDSGRKTVDKSDASEAAKELNLQEPAAGVPRPPRDYATPQNTEEKKPWWKFMSKE